VGQKWEGTGFLYIGFALFFLILLPVSFSTYQLQQIVKDEDNIMQHKDKVLFGTSMTLEPVIQFIEQFPTLRIEEGKASVDVAQPYYLYMTEIAGPGKQTPFMVIDTTGQTKNTVATEAFILITDKYMFTREEDGTDNKRVDFSEVQDAIIDKHTLFTWLGWQPLIYFPGMLVVHFVVYCLNALIFGLFGVGLCRYMKIDFTYKPNIRLAAITSTPVIFLEVISSLFDMQLFAKPSLIYLFAHAAFMFHAVESNKKKYKE
jgi:hypothetical protein